MLHVHTNVQELWRGEEGASSQVHGVFEHEEEVEMAHQVSCQFIHKSAQEQREEDYSQEHHYTVSTSYSPDWNTDLKALI